MPKRSITVAPWRGHGTIEKPGERTVKQLDDEAIVCVETDGLRGQEMAKYVQKDDLVCLGCLYRVVEEPKEQDAARAAG